MPEPKGSDRGQRLGSPAPRGIEQPPDLTDDDDEILNRIWARIAAEDKAKEAAKRQKSEEK